MCMCYSKGTFSLCVCGLFFQSGGGGGEEVKEGWAAVVVAAGGKEIHQPWEVEIVSKPFFLSMVIVKQSQ